jgi:hypothetical protein
MTFDRFDVDAELQMLRSIPAKVAKPAKAEDGNLSNFSNFSNFSRGRGA